MADKDSLPSLEALKQKLEAARHPLEKASPKTEKTMNPFRVGTELVSGVLAGSIAGYFLDKFLDTKPVFFLVCFFLGAIAGGLNIYKATTKNSKE